METAIPALIIITLIIFAVLTISHSYLSAQDALHVSRREMEVRAGERVRTDLSVVKAEALGTGDVIEVTIRNDGETRLIQFHRWDVIAHYETAATRLVEWYPYVQAVSPGTNQWTVTGIYLDALQAVPEVYEPGILNAGEEMVLRLAVSPPVGEGTANLIKVTTYSGISASAVFTR